MHLSVLFQLREGFFVSWLPLPVTVLFSCQDCLIHCLYEVGEKKEVLPANRVAPETLNPKPWDGVDCVQLCVERRMGDQSHLLVQIEFTTTDWEIDPEFSSWLILTWFEKRCFMILQKNIWILLKSKFALTEISGSPAVLSINQFKLQAERVTNSPTIEMNVGRTSCWRPC